MAGDGEEVSVSALLWAKAPEAASEDCDKLDCLTAQSTSVENDSVVSGLIGGALLGLLCFCVFSCLWNVVKVYTTRAQLNQVAVKPPSVPVSGCGGLQRFWGWLIPVFTVKTEDIYQSAGMDAVVLLKTMEFGICCFGPMAIVCMTMFLPFHYLMGDKAQVKQQAPVEGYTLTVPFEQFTIANIPGHRQEALWFHVVWMYAVVIYTLWLLRHFYEGLLKYRGSDLLVGEQLRATQAADARLHYESPAVTQSSMQALKTGDGRATAGAAAEAAAAAAAACAAAAAAAAAVEAHPAAPASAVAAREAADAAAAAATAAAAAAATAAEHSSSNSSDSRPCTAAAAAAAGVASRASKSEQGLGAGVCTSASTFSTPSDPAAVTLKGTEKVSAAGRWRRGTSKVSAAKTLRRAPSMNAISRDRNLLDASFQRSVDPAFTLSFRMAADTDVPTFSSSIPESQPVTRAFVDSATYMHVDSQTHNPSPVRWWVPRKELSSAPSHSGTLMDDHANETAEAALYRYNKEDEQSNKTFWYDQEAALSRKASVRFRRSADVMLPTYASQGEAARERKQSVEVHKYCVLVTDVPVDAIKAQHARDKLRSSTASRALNTTSALEGFGGLRESFTTGLLGLQGKLVKGGAFPSWNGRSARSAAAAPVCEALHDTHALRLHDRMHAQSSAALHNDACGSCELGHTECLHCMSVLEEALQDTRCDGATSAGAAGLTLGGGDMHMSGSTDACAQATCTAGAERIACAAHSTPAAGAVGEAQEFRQQNQRADHRTSTDSNPSMVSRDMLPMAASAALETPVPELQMVILEDSGSAQDEAASIGVDAAAAIQYTFRSPDHEAQLEGKHLREEVSATVARAFDTIFPDANPRLIPVLNHKKVHKQLLKWDRLHEELESIQAIEERLKRKERKGGTPFQPVQCRTGFLGLCGAKVVAREWIQARIRECEQAIDRERHEVFEHGIARSYFVLFETQTAAAVAAQALIHGGDGRLYQTKMAPGPDNVNWSALWCSPCERTQHLAWGGVMFAVLLVIPLGAFAGALNAIVEVLCKDKKEPVLKEKNLTELPETDPGLRHCFYQSQLLLTLVTVLLPASLVYAYQALVLPKAFYCIALFERAHKSLSALDRRVLMMYYYWDVFNLFLGSLIGGSLTQQISDIVEDSAALGDTLGTVLPVTSNFFINYLALRALGLVPMKLIFHRAVTKQMLACCSKVMRWLRGLVGVMRGHPGRDRRASILTPVSIRYGRDLGDVMLVFIIGFAYVAVSPLVVVLATLYFMSNWLVWRWQIVYVFVRCYEGGGELWVTFVRCVMGCMYICILFTGCVLSARKAFWQASLVTVPLIIIITQFWRYLIRKYHPPLQHVPLEVSARGHRVKINDMSYISAPLRPKCVGWHPEWGKAWENWDAPNYVF